MRQAVDAYTQGSAGTAYYVQINEVPPAGYVATSSAVSASSAVAYRQELDAQVSRPSYIVATSTL